MVDAPAPPPGSTEPGRVSWPRAATAILVFLGLALLTVAYHDGAFGTEDVADDRLGPGPHRFKGTVEAWDPTMESFRLRDASGARDFQWNITTPDVGRTYVVDAELMEDGSVHALALTRILLIEDSW